ncbi:MAG: serine/threonine-protein kinase [Planctomycetota bacterium]
MQLTRIGPFALEEILDRSPDGNVLRGVHIERQTAMAVKLLPPEAFRRAMGRNTFPEDVKRLQKLVHPGIARLYGGAVENGQPYLALELVDGEPLADRLQRLGKLPWEEVVELAEKITAALKHAHVQRIAHRRLTPGRVLLGPAGAVKLTGFDCCWTDQDEVVGFRSPLDEAHFLSPEQFRGKQSVELPACDLFSLGAILYVCLTGQPPWPARSVKELVLKRREGPAPRVSETVLDCPVWLDVFVAKLIAKKRADRFATAEEVHRALANAKHKLSTGVGAAQQAWSGQRGALTVDSDRSEVRRIKDSGSSIRVPRGPFYEQAWFLALCLALVVGGGVWSLLPPGEEALYAKAKPLMDSDSPVDWRRAKDQYLAPLLERFPDTEHAEDIAAFEARYAKHRALKSIESVFRTGRQPKHEAEARFSEAWQHQQFGHQVTAWKEYEAFIAVFGKGDDPEARPYVELAREQIEKIRSSAPGEGDLAEFVQTQLDRAARLYQSGQLLEARKLLDSLIMLYGEYGEVEPLIQQARELLRQVDTGRATN